jgi:hypothetical protein
MDEVHGVLERADVLKPTLSAAVELLAAEHGVTDATPLAEVAHFLAAVTSSKSDKESIRILIIKVSSSKLIIQCT